jgi:hypothetical protein
MAGKSFTRGTAKRLDAYGEENIFASYVQYRHVKNMLRGMEPNVGKMSKRMFYDWLHADKSDGRWARWKDTLKIVAADLAEEALAIADGSDPETVRVARLQIEQRRWMAERYDRESFGKTDINMVIGISADQEFLVALKAVEEKAKAKREEEIEEADYEIVKDNYES